METQPESRPNILWIVTTQWRAQACGYAGDPNARTPRLDELASRSTNYAQAVTPHPFGPFARAAMLTGVRSPQNGVSDYYDPLPSGARTIAHEMRDRGYATAFFGKWHLGRRDPRQPLVGEEAARTIVPPEGRGGFEFWEGFDGGFQLNNPWLHGTRTAVPVQRLGYQSDVVCGAAADFLPSLDGAAASPAKSRTKPWFTMVSLEAPHPPYAAQLPEGVPGRDPARMVLRANVPLGGEIERKARVELAGYHAHIEATDAAIGRLLDRVLGRRWDSAVTTVVVFTSVHGDMHGSHGLFRKGWPHEESVRVPLLVWMSRGASLRSDAAVTLADLARMTLRWADGPVGTPPLAPAKCQTGIVGADAGDRRCDHALISMPSVVRLEHQCERAWRGVRTATRKLILNPDGSPWLFYDLKSDPLEMNNLVDFPAEAAERDELSGLITAAG